MACNITNKSLKQPQVFGHYQCTLNDSLPVYKSNIEACTEQVEDSCFGGCFGLLKQSFFFTDLVLNYSEISHMMFQFRENVKRLGSSWGVNEHLTAFLQFYS